MRPVQAALLPVELHAVKEKVLRFVPRFLRNRYGAGILAMVLWIGLFADYDLYTMFKLRLQLHSMVQQRDHYEVQIGETRAQLNELTSNQELLEKCANEDVFVLVPKK